MSDESQTSTETAETTTEATESPEAEIAASDQASVNDAAGQESGAEKPAGAPESYAEFTLPEGMKLDKMALKQAIPIFKQMNLTQDQAQQLVTLKAEGVRKMEEAFQADKNQRLEAIRKDKEIGGDNFKHTEQVVARALDSFLNADEQAELVAYIDRFGASPVLAKLMYRVGKGMAEDSRMESGSKSRAEPDREAILKNMYPSMF
jgi:hypothetical protein